jgi:tetratricopeptide (TPR) repeat protein
MKRFFSLQRCICNILILMLLSILVLAPRPFVGELYLARANELSQKGDYAPAAEYYTLAASRLPWVASLWERAGDDYLQAKDYLRAGDAFEQAVAHHSLSSNGYIHWGDAIFAAGNPEFAVNLWNDQVQKGSQQPDLWYRLAQGYRALSNDSLETQSLQKYLAAQPSDAAAQYRLGLLLASSSPTEALAPLARAAKLDPTFDASVQILRSDLNTALLSEDPAYRLVISGRSLGTLGEWKLAVAAFRNAVAVQPGYADAWAWLAEAEQQRGRDGTVEIEKAKALAPDSAMVQGLFGLYLQRQMQPVKALAAFQVAALLEPENPGWQMALGKAYEQTDDLVEALDHYQRAVELAPRDASAWRALADFCLRDGVDLAGIGLPAVRKLVELESQDWQSLDIAGRILMDMDDLPGAKALLEKALELGHGQAAPALHLALLFLQTDDRQAAYPYLVQAKNSDPGGPYGWQAQRLLEQYFP